MVAQIERAVHKRFSRASASVAKSVWLSGDMGGESNIRPAKSGTRSASGGGSVSPLNLSNLNIVRGATFYHSPCYIPNSKWMEGLFGTTDRHLRDIFRISFTIVCMSIQKMQACNA